MFASDRSCPEADNRQATRRKHYGHHAGNGRFICWADPRFENTSRTARLIVPLNVPIRSAICFAGCLGAMDGKGLARRESLGD